MADIREIVEEPRTVEGDDSAQAVGGDLPQRNGAKRKRSKKRRNSAGSQNPLSGNGERREVNENRKQNDPPPVDAQREEVLPVREEHKAKFYEDYRKVSEDYDKDFINKYDEDLNTTLIFAGLFSAVTSAFIIQVDPQLHPDSGDETAALLRILIYQINNTALGDNVPTPPQWTGPPPTMVRVQAILYSSLAASLLSAFIAMLGKQWLNRYASTDMQRSNIERGQDRQRKLDGVNGWYFDLVMESLPLMLQIALLLLGFALSRYLWETSITIASVILGVTAFGLLFYFFILVAGTIWDTCPYQTPGSRCFRYIRPRITSRTINTIALNIKHYRPWWSKTNVAPFLRDMIFEIPVALVKDVFLLCKAFVLFPFRLASTVLKRLSGTTLTPEQQQTALDLRCISWTLQTSLEEPVRRSILKHLTTVAAVTDLDPTLITACFDIFVRCVGVSNGKANIVQGLDQLATLSADCFLQILRRLWATRPAPSVLQEITRCYRWTFPTEIDFQGLPFHQVAANIHVLASQRYTSYFEWEYCELSDQGLVSFARCMVKAAEAEYEQTQNKKMPRRILRFSLHFLSQDPQSSTSVIADCLTIIAIALDHDLSNVSVSDESVRVEQVSNLIIQTLETMAGDPDADPSFQSKRKAVSALFPYAVHLSQGGQQGMVNAILGVASKPAFSGFMWRRIGTYIATPRLFNKSNPPSWNEPIIIASNFADWEDRSFAQSAVTRWASAVFPTPYSEEVGRNVVIGLFRIGRIDSLRPHIPIYVWAWLKRRPSLPPACEDRFWATGSRTVSHIRGLGDLEILKSYFILVWSEWNYVLDSGQAETEIIIREEFCGTAMGKHRQDLTERLDHILGELGQGITYLKQREPYLVEVLIKYRKKCYRRLKKVLEEVEALPEP